MKCENCGNNIEPGKDICPVCGKEQHNYDRPDYFGRYKRGRGSDLRVVIITLLVAVPYMVVLLIFAFRLGNNSNQDKVTAATVTDASEEQRASDQKEVTSLEEQGVPADVFSSAGNAAKSNEVDIVTETGNSQRDNGYFESKMSEKSQIREAKKLDIRTAKRAKMAIESILDQGAPEQILYLKELATDEPVVVNDKIMEADTTGTWKLVKDIMGEYEFEVHYTDSGATAYSFQIVDDSVIFYTGTDVEPAKWKIYPDTDDGYME